MYWTGHDDSCTGLDMMTPWLNAAFDQLSTPICTYHLAAATPFGNTQPTAACAVASHPSLFHVNTARHGEAFRGRRTRGETLVEGDPPGDEVVAAAAVRPLLLLVYGEDDKVGAAAAEQQLLLLGYGDGNEVDATMTMTWAEQWHGYHNDEGAAAARRLLLIYGDGRQWEQQLNNPCQGRMTNARRPSSTSNVSPHVNRPPAPDPQDSIQATPYPYRQLASPLCCIPAVRRVLYDTRNGDDGVSAQARLWQGRTAATALLNPRRMNEHGTTHPEPQEHHDRRALHSEEPRCGKARIEKHLETNAITWTEVVRASGQSDMIWHRWRRWARVGIISVRGGEERRRRTLAIMRWVCGGEFRSPVDRRWAVQICASLAGHTNVLVPLGGVGCRPTSSGFDVLDAVSENVYEPYAHQFSSFVVCLCLETCPMVDDNTRGKIFEGEEERRTCTTYREIRLHGENLGLNGGSAGTEVDESSVSAKARRGEEEKREEQDEDIRFLKHLVPVGRGFQLELESETGVKEKVLSVFVRLQGDGNGWIGASDCQGFENPQGFWVGYAGVRVRVEISVPLENPYPQQGSGVLPREIF
ncbi:hypothetical protein BDZ97DRAFT_1760417 [Flammula alnicola]|nr:hypothetical protein BDZ97DRAFT_1760417 [Flammula alnicola]